MLSEEKFDKSSIERYDRLSKGLNRISSGGIDAVLLDLGLPDSQGIETFEKVHLAAQKIPILILTANKNDDLALQAVHKGAQDYLIKGKTDSALLVRAIAYAIERKKAEEALERQAELIDLSPDAIIIKKPDGTITFWSLGAERLYGWSKSEAIGQKTQTLLKTKSHQSPKLIETQLKQEGKWQGEVIHHTKDKRAVSVQSYWEAKLNEHGDITEIFESNVDITERKDAERLAAIGATAGMVGHDIRNPLQSVIGELYLLKGELNNLPENNTKANMRESVDAIESNVAYINKIVTDLQDYAKPLNPCIEEVDLNKLVGEVFSMLKTPENVQIIKQIDPQFPRMQTDAAAMKRVLTNLCNNAIQAMPKGGKLTLSATIQNSVARITVRDTGVGIPEEHLDKLFKPLFTTKSKGQGFGLAVVKKLTEGLNGRITVESQVGKGTTFAMEFPVK